MSQFWTTVVAVAAGISVIFGAGLLVIKVLRAIFKGEEALSEVPALRDRIEKLEQKMDQEIRKLSHDADNRESRLRTEFEARHEITNAGLARISEQLAVMSSTLATDIGWLKKSMTDREKGH